MSQVPVSNTALIVLHVCYICDIFSAVIAIIHCMFTLRISMDYIEDVDIEYLNKLSE